MTSTLPTVNQSHALDDLARRVTGRLTTPADPGWEAARTPWVVNIPQHPMAVLEVRDVDDVIAAVRWAVDHGAQVTAQPSGHGANDTLENAVILRTRALGGIEVDLDRRTAWVGAGVKAGELCAELDGTGLVFLCGSNPDPSVVGMTITGGISWFGRAFGLGADSIVTVELVDGLGRLRRVSATEGPELFWAVRGGGGDFGIITRVEVALHPAPEVYGGRLMWPVERMHEVLTTFRDVTRTAPEELTTWFHTWSFPPLPEVPEPVRGRSFTGVAVAFLGGREEAEAVLAPFRAVGGLAMDTLGPVPLSQLAAVAGEPTDPMPGMTRSHLLEDLDDDTITALTAVVGPDSGSPLPVVQIRHFGGAFTRRPEGAGSHGPVSEPYSLFALGVPAVPELVEVISRYFGRISAAVAGVASGRTLLNFLEAGQDPSLWWTPETRERLVRAKQSSDPLQTIRSNRPVRG
ncbi:MAG: FAD-binding oxidoreductase [Marmoricola sp.]|nr:FAD-binding oxidoreductase [Marmoricola sp.]